MIPFLDQDRARIHSAGARMDSPPSPNEQQHIAPAEWQYTSQSGTQSRWQERSPFGPPVPACPQERRFIALSQNPIGEVALAVGNAVPSKVGTLLSR